MGKARRRIGGIEVKTLYVSDLDGTLLGSNGELSQKSADIINSLIEKGMNFTVATARSASSAKLLLEKLNLKIPAVMMNGVFLTDIKAKEHKYVCPMKKDTAERIIKAFQNGGRPPFVYSFKDGNIECEYTALKTDYEREFAKVRKQLYYRFDKVENYNIGDNNTVYINGMDDKEIIDAVIAGLNGIEGIKYSNYLDTYSGNKYFLEVYSEKAGKWNTIKKLKEMYGFEKIVAFGDNGNDVEMLKNADLAVAVGNAQPIAKSSADIIIGSNDEDGVAQFLLGQI